MVVKDVPGFYVNRCLGPYLVEVSALIRDGVPLEKLDSAVKKFGMPVGPITLADEVGTCRAKCTFHYFLLQNFLASLTECTTSLFLRRYRCDISCCQIPFQR